VTLRTDVYEGRFGKWAIGSLDRWSVLVDLDQTEAGRGDVLEVTGDIGGGPGTAAGRVYHAVLDVASVEERVVSRFPLHRAGAWMRGTVMERLRPMDDGRSLLAGFLIGDTSRIAEADIEAMRKSGLAHFVAVSGSNVALFLGLLAVITGPLAIGPRRRAVIGLMGLPLYAAATRFEPSVLRASAMAGIALGGRLVGIVLEAWQLLALAVGVLVVLDPSLTANVGFQLSVAATAGVLLGARWPVRGVIRRALAITIGAQLSVAPLLLVHFGSVPLLSPLVNLVAAPLVTVATLVGALGVAGIGFLIGPASLTAEVVLALARSAAGWPQLGPAALAMVGGAGLLIMRLHWLRPIGVGVASVLLVIALVPERLHPGSAVVLDVGQGDAILLHGGRGRHVLVDGGPDGAVLLERLRAYGVTELELVVLTHPHADHATGLAELVGQMRITEVWADTEPHTTEASQRLFEALDMRGIPVTRPSVGQRRDVGALAIAVRGPLRRYASPNDQSIVLEISAPRTLLLAGDIETYAQSDLSDLRAEVLKVPHQGAATSDPDWLVGVGADLAVISVGPNSFGHPADWVVEILEGSGAEVRRTDIDGDVLVDLS
jgi:competence protein ComEC